jgi:hypothetical protein
MSSVGYLLITIGFLAGSYSAVTTPENTIPWSWFIPSLVVAILGVVLARAGKHQAARGEGVVAAKVDVLTSRIDRIVENITRLDAEKTEMHPSDVHTRIDELFPDDLAAFVEARESVGHAYGLPAYAAMMNEFAAGERYLNRVWSASVDAYIEDVHEYLGRSKQQFIETQRILAGLTGGPGGG